MESANVVGASSMPNNFAAELPMSVWTQPGLRGQMTMFGCSKCSLRIMKLSAALLLP